MDYFKAQVDLDIEKSNKDGLPQNAEKLEYYYDTMAILDEIVSQDEIYEVYDLISKDTIYKLDIGEITPGLEMSIFDSLIVSPSVPYACINIGDTDRYFKIDETSFYNKKLIKKTDTHNTIQIQIKIPGRNKYCTAYYKFEDGMYIKILTDLSESIMEETMIILNKALPNLTIGNQLDTVSLSTSFIINQVIIDPQIFAQMLVNKIKIGSNGPFLIGGTVLNPKEQDRPLAFKSQFKMILKLGNLTSSVAISKKVVQSNNIFYLDGAPVKLDKESDYSMISIKKILSKEEAELVRKIISIYMYVYGTNVSKMKDNLTVSDRIAKEYNTILEMELYSGFQILETSRVAAKTISGGSRKIAVLKRIDPGFYSNIPVAWDMSVGQQPEVITSTYTPNWEEILREKIRKIEESHKLNPKSPKIQIIRWPLILEDSDEQIKSKVRPYFLAALPDAPNFHLKPILEKNRYVDDETYIPFMPKCAAREYIEYVSYEDMEYPDTLFDLDRDFVVKLKSKGNSSSKSTRILITAKIAAPDHKGSIPKELELVLNKFVDPNYYIVRIGQNISPLSILGILDTESDDLFDTKNKINEATNWNVCKQELYSMSAQEIQDYFMRPDTIIDPSLFYRALEDYFKTNIYTVLYSAKGEIKLEIPRHKFLHLVPNKPRYSKSVLIFKHSPGRKNNTHCEEIVIYDEKEDVRYDWNAEDLKSLFDEYNNSNIIKIHDFKTEDIDHIAIPEIKINASIKPDISEIFPKYTIISQYIDAAGKLRGVEFKYLRKTISIATEPLIPISVAKIVKPHGNDLTFDNALKLIESLNGDDIQVGIDYVWFKVQGIQLFIYVKSFSQTEYIFNHNRMFSVKSNYMSEIEKYNHQDAVINVMYQLLVNIYVDLNWDNFYMFFDKYTIVKENHEYKLPGYVNVPPEIELYEENYPTFVKGGKFVFNNKIMRTRFMKQIYKVQKLKEDLFEASNGTIEFQEDSEFNTYEHEGNTSAGLDKEYAIDNIDSMKEYYNRPTYIKYLYVSESDFRIRSTSQRIFMDADRLIEYLNLNKSEKYSTIVLPFTHEMSSSIRPLFYVSSSGSTYIIQNVLDGNVDRASNVVDTWARLKTNLGYLAEPINDGKTEMAVTINEEELLLIDDNIEYCLFKQKSGKYSAVMKI